MFPFWEPIVAPIIRATGAQRFVEIGALRGETTIKMLEDLGPEAELHVIDPVPEFDPTEHERRFGGRYVFHRDLSLNVLENIGPMDVALIDGDHNWYTVYNECRQLAIAAEKEGKHLPVMVLHDVCFPYGRRDLYYAPEQIPAEFRQPHRKAGIHPDRKKLLGRGGMNQQLDNAIEEGGPRNGVRTGLDDFLAEHPHPVRRVLLPIYWGLEIVVEERRLATLPELEAILDRLESPEGQHDLLLLGERIRIDAAMFEQSFLRYKDNQIAEGRERYLSLLKAGLLGELDNDNDLRVAYLLRCIESNRQPDPAIVRDPAIQLGGDRVSAAAMREARRTGATSGQRGVEGTWCASMGQVRLEHLERSLDAVREGKVPGDLLECGVERGGGGIFLRGYLDAWYDAARTVWIADPFRPSDRSADLNAVRTAYERYGLLDDRVRILQGDYSGVLPAEELTAIALLRIGTTAGADVETILDACYDQVSNGGIVVIDGHDDPAVAEAVARFRERRGISALLERVDWWGVSWQRDVATEGPAAADAGTSGTRHRAPLAPKAAAEPVDLTVVVAFHNMKREAARTLHSLSRAYQRGIEDLTYEVLAVDNGSAPDQRLDPDFVASFGPEFRLIDMGPDAPSSPTVAMNRGMIEGRGNAFALLVDGAHVLTPGVLRHGTAALSTYDHSVVATQQFYVGPGQQPDAVRHGYDQEREDALFEQIQWPSDGYRLFEVSHFIGDRDWFDGIIETNCLFATRALLAQVGGFDDAFDMPGGGYTNLELFERCAAAPDVTLATMLGEGSFHQVHGGTTTNDADVDGRRKKTFGYGEHYEALRGRLLRGPAGPIHYVGAFPISAACRTRSRRLAAPAFSKSREVGGSDGRPTTPDIIPDDMRLAFTESFWQSLAWSQLQWLGRPVEAAPTDLLAYQEILSDVRPDWVIETGTGNGGRALFLASVCDLLGHGQVVSVDQRQGDDLPQHPRITYVHEAADTPEGAAAVQAIVGEAPRAVVVLGARSGAQRTRKEFDLYHPMVPSGSYLIVEHTVLNGRPVWPGFGPGPNEALRRILPLHGDFHPDPARERYGLTFNPGGFLKRT
jgi:cephalosporin hydroxylase/peptidoglycan hydrolase-like protein with peptidoglycan-binding domain